MSLQSLPSAMIRQDNTTLGRGPTDFYPRSADPNCHASLALGSAPSLVREEAGHRLANLTQLTLCNLARAARAVDGPAKQAIGRAMEQVSAASRLTRMLDIAGDMSVGRYLQALGETLDQLLLRPAGHSITVEVHTTEDIALPEQVIRSLGQLVFEAVLNAAKHAFPTGPGGHVAIGLSRVGAWLYCRVADDGVGSRGTLGRPGSRGMVVMDGLAQQMGGRCRWVFGGEGTEIQVAWPVEATNHQTEL